MINTLIVHQSVLFIIVRLKRRLYISYACTIRTYVCNVGWKFFSGIILLLKVFETKKSLWFPSTQENILTTN